MPLSLFISLAFVLNLVILLFIKPSGTGGEIDEEKIQKIPQLFFKNFQMFDIGSNSIVETTLTGQTGEVFRDGSYKIQEVEVKYQNSKYIENIKSRYAYYTKSNLEATGGVIYHRSDNSSIKTDKLSYDIDNRYFYIPNQFVFKRDDMIIKGKSLVIDRNKGKIKAFHIDAILQNNKKRE